MERIEIDARRRRHMRLLQHALGEGMAVVGEVRDIRIQIERAIGRQERFDSGLRKSLDQNAAIDLVALLHRFHFGHAVERRLRRHL